jgi:hypothetical protein
MRTLAFALMLGLLAALSGAARPLAAPDKKADFDALLKQAKASLDTGRYKEAKEILVTKLADHKGADYVKEKLESIRADVKTCSFRLAFPPKQLADLLSGDVSGYDPKTGQVTITYDRKAKEAKKPPEKFPGGDVTDVSGENQFKYPFAGPFTLTFQGKALTENCPLVRVCIREDESLLFELDRKGLTCLDRMKGDVADGEVSMTNIYNVLRPYTLKIAVRETQFEALLDGKRVLVGDKPKGVFGPARYWSVKNLDRIEVSGKIDKEWIQGQIDGRSKVDLVEFEKTYDAKADLPEWLR